MACLALKIVSMKCFAEKKTGNLNCKGIGRWGRQVGEEGEEGRLPEVGERGRESRGGGGGVGCLSAAKTTA